MSFNPRVVDSSKIIINLPTLNQYDHDMEREEVKYAVNTMLNDVIEQAFHFLVQHPQESDEINKIIREAGDEMNYQLLKVDAHTFKISSPALQTHFNLINKDVHKKSLELLSRLQTMQKSKFQDSDQVRYDSASDLPA